MHIKCCKCRIALHCISFFVEFFFYNSFITAVSTAVNWIKFLDFSRRLFARGNVGIFQRGFFIKKIPGDTATILVFLLYT